MEQTMTNNKHINNYNENTLDLSLYKRKENLLSKVHNKFPLKLIQDAN